MKLSRLIKRIRFYTEKSLISLLVYFDHRLYMKFYNKLLKKSGFNLNGVPRFIAKSVRFDDFSQITLGDRIIISMNVHFLTHDYSITTASIALGNDLKSDVVVKKKIVVGDNVFIGMNTLILPGTKIGNNVIIGAGSVVRGVIEDNSVVIGNPAIVVSDIRKYGKKTIENNSNLIIIDNK